MQHLGLLLLLGSTNITNDSWFLPDSVPCDFWYRCPVSVENPALIPRYKAEASRFFGSWRLRFHLEFIFFGPLDWNHCIDWNQRNQHQNRDTGRFWLSNGFSQPQPKCGWFFLKSFSLWNLEGNPLKDTPRNLRPDSFDDWRWLFFIVQRPEPVIEYRTNYANKHVPT